MKVAGALHSDTLLQLLITIEALIAMEILAPVAGVLVAIQEHVLLELCLQVLEREGLRLRDPGAGHLEHPIIIVSMSLMSGTGRWFRT